MSEESTSPKPRKKATIKVAKAKDGNVDVVFDLAIKGMLLVQIILALTAFLYEIDYASDNDVAGTITFATFLSYVAIVAIVYSLSLLIGNESKSPITRIFAFGYYILLLGILFQAATDPAGGVTAAIAGGF